MSRVAIIALAVAFAWAAGHSMANATGALDTHTPGHAAKGGATRSTARQHEAVPAERQRPKDVAGHVRRSIPGDRAIAKHSHRLPQVERHTTKQSSLHVRRPGRALHIDAKHKSQSASSQNRKLRRGIKVTHSLAKKVPADRSSGRHGPPRKS